MDVLAEFFKIDLVQWLFCAFIIGSALLLVLELIAKLSMHIGKPVKWIRNRTADHEMIINTANSLKLLHDQHNNDIKAFTQEMRDIIAENNKSLNDKIVAMGNTLRNERLEERTHDRGQSFEREKRLQDANQKTVDSIKELSLKLDQMQQRTDKRFTESEEKNNKRIRAELKDKISNSYRRYHALGKINRMELEALEGLIEEYEAADGENSFVHSVVQKEMYVWKQVDE